MRINNFHLTQSAVGAGASIAGAEEAQRRERMRKANVDKSRHTPSPEVTRWLQQMRGQPDVRLDLLQRVAQQLATGIYFTQATALRTAEAMLTATE